MKIGIDASNVSGWRGPSRNIRNLVRALPGAGKDHQFVLFSPDPAPINIPNVSNCTWMQVQQHHLVPWLNISLPLECRKHALDVFLFPSGNFWLWKPMRTVVQIRSYAIEPWGRGWIERISAFLKRQCLDKIADVICPVSMFNAQLLHIDYGIDFERMKVIPNGVDPVFSSARTRYSAYGDYALYVGGTEKIKNLERLFAAFRIVSQQYPDLKLVIVGGDYKVVGSGSGPRDRVHALGLDEKVIFHGIERDDNQLAMLYAGARVCVVPSLIETFGLVALEAMAAGCPVAASNAPSIPEIAGDAVLYFDPYDTKDMACKIGSLIKDSDLRRVLICKGRERAGQFSWDETARKVILMIEDAVRR